MLDAGNASLRTASGYRKCRDSTRIFSAVPLRAIGERLRNGASRPSQTEFWLVSGLGVSMRNGYHYGMG